MEYDDSDEYGFWQPAPARRLRAPWISAIGGATATPSTPAARRDRVPARRVDEPTRQLRATPPRRSAHDGSVASAAASPTPAGGALPDRRDPDGQADYYRQLSDLLDQDVAVAMGDTLPLVDVATRRSWWSRARRDDGRLDPIVTKVGLLALVVAVALSLVPLLSAGAGRTNGVAVVAPPPTDATSPATAVADAAVAETAAEPIAADAPASTPQAATTGRPVSQTVPAVVVAPTAATVVAAPAQLAVTPSGAGVTASSDSDAASPDRAIEALRSCSVPYAVAAGDYWLGIAGRAGVTVAALLAANNATAATPLYAGRTICLPRGTVTPLPAATPVTSAAPTTVVPATTTPQPTTKVTPPKRTSVVTVPTTTPPTTTPATVAVPTTAARSKSVAQPTTATPTTSKPTTTTAAPTTTTVPAKVYTRDQVAQIIRSVWPDDLEDKAIAIAMRESNLNPGVRNFCCYGLFQIYYSVHQSWLAAMGISSANQLFDPTANAEAALALYYRDGGWGPWGG